MTHHTSQYNPTAHPWRQRPAEYLAPIPGLWPGGWIQNEKVRHKVKPHYHWIWPKDGKRGSKLGRMKDILQGKGPDIHVTISADKMDYMYNRQRRARWGKWTHLNDLGPDGALPPPIWVDNQLLGGRDNRQRYDFYCRKYHRIIPGMWTDAIWQGPNKNSRWPDQWRDLNGFNYQDDAWNPFDPTQP